MPSIAEAIILLEDCKLMPYITEEDEKLIIKPLIEGLQKLQGLIKQYEEKDKDYCIRIDKAMYWVIQDVLKKKGGDDSETTIIHDGRNIKMEKYSGFDDSKEYGYRVGSIDEFIEDLKSPSKGLKQLYQFKALLHRICYSLSRLAKIIGCFAAAGSALGAGAAAIFGLPLIVTALVGGATGGGLICLYGIFNHKQFDTPLEQKLSYVKGKIVELQDAPNKLPDSPVRLEAVPWESVKKMFGRSPSTRSSCT